MKTKEIFRYIRDHCMAPMFPGWSGKIGKVRIRSEQGENLPLPDELMPKDAEKQP